ncbi:androgen-dependent TFPI-regulating protein-like isoform X1 [Protopterus annectens]|uniref:androgen-dependent TFPI-regulating protein-like isoform X1 n=1 Tax=Protopterus annectens TaxID=7888 RepID=UPI001CFAD3AE|nr:androgen-dependent TFPI-regulating protein-like isoform X1 [Protopterus annectens]
MVQDRRFNTVVLHFIICAWYVFTVAQNMAITSLRSHPGVSAFGGRWKYLTFINLVLQAVFFSICFLADIGQLWDKVKEKQSLSTLVSFRDGLFSVLAFPVGTFVVISFWALYTYDRELVFPKHLDAIIPTWLNHAMHTFILPLLLVELYAVRHQYPKKKHGLLGLAVFCILYLVWVFYIKYAADIWVYPVLAQLSHVGMVVFFSLSFLIFAYLYFLGEMLSMRFWGKSEHSRKKAEHSRRRD